LDQQSPRVVARAGCGISCGICCTRAGIRIPASEITALHRPDLVNAPTRPCGSVAPVLQENARGGVRRALVKVNPPSSMNGDAR
jgi:hypothetical protein